VVDQAFPIRFFIAVRLGGVIFAPCQNIALPSGAAQLFDRLLVM